MTTTTYNSHSLREVVRGLDSRVSIRHITEGMRSLASGETLSRGRGGRLLPVTMTTKTCLELLVSRGGK